ncbi:MAG TPA: MFS transporter [Acidimicrobiales bacterium]|nr:MFS transporter [Acidimicrobiales bacterium]
MAELIAAHPGADSEQAARARKRRLLVLYICSLSLLIVNIDSTALNVALPAIQRTFNASLSSLQWVTDAYVLVISILMLAAGSMGDRVGRRRVFRYGLVIFVLGSLACSLAPSVETLIAFRMLQAVGGSMLNPIALSIITHTFDDRRERARAIGLWSATYGIALSAGPVVGGLLVDSLGWRWVFWINVPIGAAALVLTTIFVPESRAARPRRVDVPGQTIIIAALGALTYAIIEGPTAGWTSAEIVGLFSFAAAMTVAFVAVELRVSEPLVEVRFFKSPPFSAAGIAATLSFFVMGGFLFVNTLYLQEVRHESALLAGLALLPATVFIALLSPVAGHIVGRNGPRVPLVVGGLTTAAGTAVLVLTEANSSYSLLIAAYCLIGIGMGFVNPPITNTAVSGMPVNQAGVAGAVAATSRQVGTVLGIALLGSLLAEGFRTNLTARLAVFHLPPQKVAALAAAGAGAARLARTLHVRSPNAVEAIVRQVFTDATHAGWWLCTAAGLVLAVVAFVSTGPRGREIAVRVLTGVDD